MITIINNYHNDPNLLLNTSLHKLQKKGKVKEFTLLNCGLQWDYGGLKDLLLSAHFTHSCSVFSLLFLNNLSLFFLPKEWFLFSEKSRFNGTFELMAHCPPPPCLNKHGLISLPLFLLATWTSSDFFLLLLYSAEIWCSIMDSCFAADLDPCFSIISKCNNTSKTMDWVPVMCTTFLSQLNISSKHYIR